MGFLNQAAFWASVAALLDSIAIAATGITEHVMVIAGAICAIVAIVESLIHAGHRLHYEAPPKQPPAAG